MLAYKHTHHVVAVQVLDHQTLLVEVNRALLEALIQLFLAFHLVPSGDLRKSGQFQRSE